MERNLLGETQLFDIVVNDFDAKNLLIVTKCTFCLNSLQAGSRANQLEVLNPYFVLCCYKFTQITKVTIAKQNRPQN